MIKEENNIDEGLKKFINTYDLDNIEILTDGGFVGVDKLHETIKYQVYELILDDGRTLKCADNHIVFTDSLTEVFVKDLLIGDEVKVNKSVANVVSVTDLGYKEHMFDFELPKGTNHRYYTNGILSHNTAVVEGLAQLIIKGRAPRPLMDKRILSLDLASVVGGTKYRGEFEQRMKDILKELTENPDIIVFIDEIHNMEGAGNSSGSLDASNILKPALARGEIQVIGATTMDEYRENIETDKALTRRFQQVILEEPSYDETLEILFNLRERYEEYHQCKFTDDAIRECVKLADRYITDRAMPDKAIDVMDEAGASTNSTVVPTQGIIDLEEEKERILNEKNEVVKNQDYENAAKLRKREKEIIDEIVLLKAEWNKANDDIINDVDITTILTVISVMSGIPLDKISTEEMSRLANIESTIEESVIGQSQAVAIAAKALKRNRLGIKDKHKPIGSFIFLGPTGVGKTHLAKQLADFVFGGSNSLIRFDMSEYQEGHTISKLIGAPQGYVGYGEGGRLTEQVRRNPYSLVLFDEIEKAHPDIFKMLLQVLDEGHLTDSLGRKVNFKNCMIVMTSNIGVKQAVASGAGMGFLSDDDGETDANRIKAIINKEVKKKFPPEFINRIDDTIIFNTLTKDDIIKITSLEINKLISRIDEIGYTLKLTKSAIEELASIGYDPEYGARPLSRAIQTHIEDAIGDVLINGEATKGDTITFSYNKTKGVMVSKVTKTK